MTTFELNRIALAGRLAAMVALAGASACAASPAVELTVTGGSAGVTDWVAEANVDLAAMQEVLGAEARPEWLAVYETTGPGAAVRVASQVDGGGATGVHTVAWRVPGELAAGAVRAFSIRFESTAVAMPQQAVSVDATGGAVRVANGNVMLEHRREHGGMIRRLDIAGASAEITWNDKIFDGRVYYLAHRRAEEL
jgi:hypothetical protein